MTKNGIFRGLVITGICCGVFAWGCEKQAQTSQTQTCQVQAGKEQTNQPESKPVVKPQAQASQAESQPVVKPQAQMDGRVKIALKSTVGQVDKYKIITDVRRTTKWQGPVPEGKTFDEGFSEERVEMAVTRRIQTVDANGVAAARVSIDGLKCFYTSKGQTTVDFDSTKSSDSNDPLMKLVGQDYVIEVNPQNVATLVESVKNIAKSDKIGAALVSPDSVIERHSTMQLPKEGHEMLKPGDKWSSIKTFMFGKMGLKSYEKIYTFKELRNNGREIAVIDMDAIPSTEIEPKYADRKVDESVLRKFDSKESYAGAGEFDVQTGRIESYHENLKATWTAALPTKQNEASGPVVLDMTEECGYSIELIK